jgi:hypothetical protein
MKNLYLRSCVALLCATSLVSCGGGSGSVLVGGTVTGLTKTGLTLTNNDGPELTIVPGTGGANVTFSFPQLIDTDANYDVKVKQQPGAAVCTPRINTNIGKGTGNVTTVFVDCVTNSYALNATVKGLVRDSVILTNGGANDLTVTADGTSAFPVQVADGAPYTVTVKKQPTDKTCSVTNGAATMPSTAATITVTCS